MPDDTLVLDALRDRMHGALLVVVANLSTGSVARRAPTHRRIEFARLVLSDDATTEPERTALMLRELADMPDLARTGMQMAYMNAAALFDAYALARARTIARSVERDQGVRRG